MTVAGWLSYIIIGHMDEVIIIKTESEIMTQLITQVALSLSIFNPLIVYLFMYKCNVIMVDYHVFPALHR